MQLAQTDSSAVKVPTQTINYFWQKTFSQTETTICAYPYSMCDENNDCGDGSDEIKKNCESLTCPEGIFDYRKSEFDYYYCVIKLF